MKHRALRVACCSVLLVAWMDTSPQATQPARRDQSWAQRIGSGESFGVLFDALESPVGTIRPQGLYVVTFRPGEQTWIASGPKSPDGYQMDVRYPAGTLCNPAIMTLCIWGAAFTFDDAGQVLMATTRVGRMQTLTVRDRIASGAPFSVLLDALTTNVGTIRAGAQYSVTYLPVERAFFRRERRSG